MTEQTHLPITEPQSITDEELQDVVGSSTDDRVWTTSGPVPYSDDQTPVGSSAVVDDGAGTPEYETVTGAAGYGAAGIPEYGTVSAADGP